jgi:alkanesulfonate monooxygenase SsuD/methylene tetrahydromethanopterin reductase-like flavin-dependent oxidoreductase (luciferase family)
VIGALSQVTSLPIETAVTCPTIRIHPAIIAQAAATSGLLTGKQVTHDGEYLPGGDRAAVLAA